MKLGSWKDLPTFMRAKDVMELVHCSQTTAYRVIKDINNELGAKGYYIPKRGVAPTKYLLERLGVF